MVVRLEAVDRADAGEHEETSTDNLSAHGVRVKSRRAWYPGEKAQITPLSEEFALRGEVVYCQKIDDERFFVGFKLAQGMMPGAALNRFD